MVPNPVFPYSQNSDSMKIIHQPQLLPCSTIFGRHWTLLISLAAANPFPSVGQVIECLHIRKQNLPMMKTNLKCKQTWQKVINKQNTFLIQAICLNFQQRQRPNNLKLKLEKFKTQTDFIFESWNLLIRWI